MFLIHDEIGFVSVFPLKSREYKCLVVDKRWTFLMSSCTTQSIIIISYLSCFVSMIILSCPTLPKHTPQYTRKQLSLIRYLYSISISLPSSQQSNLPSQPGGTLSSAPLLIYYCIQYLLVIIITRH